MKDNELFEKLEEEYNYHHMICCSLYRTMIKLAFKEEEIAKSWSKQEDVDAVAWHKIPTTEKIFDNHIIDDGDRFHHFDRNGYKRTRRTARFDNNYHNALNEHKEYIKDLKRKQSLDRIAQWAVLDSIKQDVIDDFIAKYDLSSEEIERFESVMLETYHGIFLDQRNIYNDTWYATYNARFDSHIPLV